MMRMVRTGLMALSLAIPSVSGAQTVSPLRYLDGNTLYEHCNTSGTTAFLVCSYYIIGIADVMLGSNAVDDRRMCAGMKVTNVQAVDVVKNFLTAHPELRHHNAAGLVAAALSEAFPCK